MAASRAVLMLVLLYLVKLFYCAEYYVKPDLSSTCPTDVELCFTLSEYLQNSTMYFTSGSTFTLLRGQHHLNKTLNLSDVTNITFRGPDPDMTTIFIAESGSIKWKNSYNIEINSLRVKYKGGTGTSQAALIFQDSTVRVSKVQLTGEKKKVTLYLYGIKLLHSNASFINCSFTRWQNGSAVYADNSNVTFSDNTTVRHITAKNAIFAQSSVIIFSGNNTFLENKGYLLNTRNSNIVFKGSTTIKLNKLLQVGVQVVHSSLRILNRTVVSENVGICIFGIHSNIILDGWTTFTNNLQPTSYDRWMTNCFGTSPYLSTTINTCNSTLRLNGNVTFINNTAKRQGGAFILNSRVDCEGHNILNFINNSAKKGGAIYIDNSTINCSGNISFVNNSGAQRGGGLYAINSTFNISGSWRFLENIALDGGGMALERTKMLLLHSPITMNFNSNRALSKGGGILLIPKCSIENESCFFKIKAQNFSFPNVHLNFANNSAGQAGSVLYGGSIKACYREMKSRGQFNTSLLFNIPNISNKNEMVSSDPVKVCFCNHSYIPDCYLPYKTINVSRGRNFNLTVVALGQRREAVPSTVYAYTKIHKPTTQLNQQSSTIEGKCTNITFQLLTEDKNVTLILLPLDTPCGNTDTAQAISHVILTQCPPGFTLMGNRCKCNKTLSNLEVVKCDDDNLQIKRVGNSWIKEIKDDSKGIHRFVYHRHCPINYCKPASENYNIMYFSSINFTSDVQCSSNRSGMLCGACKDEFSLTLYTFKCKRCDNRYISLLLFFVFAGVVVIAVLLALHMTVAAGTINGLILYANTVNVNSMIFLPQNSTKTFKILTVFIAWLNFDLGIETCFYNGLNSYSYAWLQYAFPLYLWFLIGLIIISSKYSTKLMKLFGSNPVAVLATIILMSYTKLLQATTQSLFHNVMEYSDGNKMTVWFYDANVLYFGHKHALLGLTALCILFFLLLPYTFLLLFSYHLQAFSRKRAFSWLNKIKPLLDAYYAPYRAKTRYWPGFMLLVRGSLYITYSVTTLSNPGANLVAVSSVFTAVALIPWLGQRVYDRLYNDILEASFILNICLLSTATYYVKYANNSEMKGVNQEIATGLSISIAFLQFLGIVCFHLYLRLKDIKPFAFLRSTLVKNSLLHSEECEEQQQQSTVKEVSMTVMDLREPLLESQQQ